MQNTVIIEQQAKKFLKKLSDETLGRRLMGKIDALALDAFPHGCKRLTHADGLYRLRVGDYRIVYQFLSQQAVVKVIFIDHRTNIYNHL